MEQDNVWFLVICGTNVPNIMIIQSKHYFIPTHHQLILQYIYITYIFEQLFIIEFAAQIMFLFYLVNISSLARLVHLKYV